VQNGGIGLLIPYTATLQDQSVLYCKGEATFGAFSMGGEGGNEKGLLSCLKMTFFEGISADYTMNILGENLEFLGKFLRAPT
jgi:hypothetical protein